MSDDAEIDDPDDDSFDEIREAAGAVVSSLKRLIDATERVIADPEAFSQAVDGGRTVVEAFIGGFTAQASSDSDDVDPDVADATTESSDGADES